MTSHGDVIGIFFWGPLYTIPSSFVIRFAFSAQGMKPNTSKTTSQALWLCCFLAAAAPKGGVPCRVPMGGPQISTSYEASSPPCFGPSCDDDVRQSISNDRGWAHGPVMASGMGPMGFFKIGDAPRWINFSYVGNVNF